MRAGGGKQKGAQMEREVCQSLSRWMSNQERDDLYWRSAMSGGRATFRLWQGKSAASAQAGDISAIDPLGAWLTEQFVIEVKHVANLNILPSILNPLGKGKLIKFWREVRELGAIHGKKPILIAKQNGLPTIMVITAAGAELLKISGGSARAWKLFEWNPHLALVYLFDPLTERSSPCPKRPL